MTTHSNRDSIMHGMISSLAALAVVFVFCLLLFTGDFITASIGG